MNGKCAVLWQHSNYHIYQVDQKHTKYSNQITGLDYYKQSN
jgi:hypothetical protein